MELPFLLTVGVILVTWSYCFTEGREEGKRTNEVLDTLDQIKKRDTGVDGKTVGTKTFKDCCHPGETLVNLVQGSVWDYKNPAVQVVTKPVAQPDVTESCSLMALLKINFEKITKTPCELYDGCLNGPYCGRQMLRIDLELASHTRKNWMFNVGDSWSKNGYKGDSNNQIYDAETDGVYPHINVWSNDLCNTKSSLKRLGAFINATLSGSVKYVTLYVSNEHIRVTNDNGLDETLCHKCLYGLNGQPDKSSGGPNEDIYVGLNRVVSNTYRRGFGVCKVRFSWMCPL